MNESIIKNCKDKDPKETIKRIKHILHNLNIKTKELWYEKSKYGTYSLHLIVENTDIGSYGKGCTKALAQASAYGEFIERYLNMILTEVPKFDDLSFYYDINEKYLKAEEIAMQNCEIINRIFRVNKVKKTKQEMIKWWRSWIQPTIKDQYVSLPFKNYTTGELCYIPYEITRWPYGSNGMASGNTKEEALVEGISEIIERYVQQQTVINKLTLPNIPDSYINRFPSIKQIWAKLKLQDKYKVYLKDASLGGKWPVVALVIINKQTSNYGIAFGAHPNFEIAAQRTFTEATQNITLENFSNLHAFYDKEIELESPDYFYNITSYGLKSYPFDFLKKKPSFDFNIFHNKSTNNKKLLKYLVDTLSNNKFEIWIKDSSCFDIPAYHIIIPNMSEGLMLTESQITNIYNTNKVKKLIKNIDQIDDKKAKFILKNLIENSNLNQLNTLSCILPANNGLKIPCGQNITGKNYLISMLYYFIKDYENAYKSFLKVTETITSKKDIEKYKVHKATEKYLLLRYKKINHKTAVEILDNFYDQQICNHIDYTFKSEKQVLKKQYPNISKMLKSDPTFYPYWESQNMTKKLLKCKELYAQLN